MKAGSALEVFTVFLKLGVTSFGGPIAHLGYFQREIVERRGWIDAARYAQLVALCQFLPGPGSSQASFALGMLRAGWSGACAAFLAFTAPSVLLLLAFAAALPMLDQPLALAAIHGLKLLAIAVVAQGLTAMAARLAPDLPRRLIAVAAAFVLILAGGTLLQLIVIGGGALLGLLVCRNAESAPAAGFELGYSHRTGIILLVLFAVLLASAFVPVHGPLAAVAAAFYRAGALVFGGGHVVLPLLHDAVVEPGWVSQADFVPDTARRRPCRDPCSRSPPSSARAWKGSTPLPARSSASSRSCCPACCWSRRRCRVGIGSRGIRARRARSRA